MSVKKVTFEEGMEELESIVAKLERGEAALDESITLFERGVALTKEMQKMLETAEKKVKLLVKDGDAIEETDFPEGSGV
ncbi:exodeoxyribonuclease VII small subunit [Acetivibrio sp. MSJd-27]|uniref:exodeoxyribonuclease VII small subunit n=1 Tax=Acetivibrio sp. MSJd-27 TaxID=2841523 RepID=UPI001C0F5732|nr:exodeoxyribonuclease VII small subunit [Acetivibrio sp. MSJd-27]MBU5449692.1 exodeoxyribonuclease VII small subunit [Acetivibrio sp. MSJd-27]